MALARARRPGRRFWLWAAAVAAVLALAGAFLAWGPIGFGNGPLSLAMGAEEGNKVSGRALLAIFMPVHNTADGGATVDSVRLIGAAGYPVPQMITLRLTDRSLCGGSWPVRAARPQLQIAGGCRARDLGPLLGHPIGHAVNHSLISAVAVVRPPGPGRCWAMTAVEVHYHVGIRHWTATEPDEFAACASTSQALLDRAMNRAGQDPPQ
jgi:hypothetical protein